MLSVTRRKKNLKISNKRKLIVYAICIALLTSAFPMIAYANTTDAMRNEEPITECYIDPKTGMEIERTIYANGDVIARAALDNEIAVAEFIGGNYYLNGKLVFDSVETETNEAMLDSFISTASVQPLAVGITWGEWSKTKSKTFSLKNATTAEIMVGIGSFCALAGHPLATAAVGMVGAAIAAGDDYFKIALKAKIGFDDKYYYAKQQYDFSSKVKGEAYKHRGSQTLNQKRPKR